MSVRSAQSPICLTVLEPGPALGSVSLSNCGNCHVEPKPSFADGSKLHNPGQPTKPKIPPCRSFSLALSIWLGNHLLINGASKIHTGTTYLANCEYFTFDFGKLFNTAPSTGLLVTLKLVVSKPGRKVLKPKPFSYYQLSWQDQRGNSIAWCENPNGYEWDPSGFCQCFLGLPPCISVTCQLGKGGQQSWSASQEVYGLIQRLFLGTTMMPSLAPQEVNKHKKQQGKGVPQNQAKAHSQMGTLSK